MRSPEGLTQKARWLRRQTMDMVAAAGKGHLGGSFSCLDILVALYYGGFVAFDPGHPKWEGRDRVILSKGHGALGIYPILADLGFFPMAELQQFTGEGSRLGGHPDWRVPGVETVSGSLGHGLSVGAGLALGARLSGQGFRTVVLLGDGECHEGSVWEAAMFAAHYQLHRLIAIVDYNKICATDFLEACLRVDSLEDKWRAFGWEVAAVRGHAFEELVPVLGQAFSREATTPFVILAHTVKGRGVSFMENHPHWHHAVPKGEQLELARRELA